MSKLISIDQLSKAPANPRAYDAEVLVRRDSGGALEVVGGARRLEVLLKEHGSAEVQVMGSGEHLRVHLTNGQVTVLKSDD